MNISHTPAINDDLDFVWKVYARTTRPFIEPLLKSGWDDPKQKEAFLTWWRPNDTIMLKSGDEPVGWVSIVRDGATLHIQHLCVLPEFQGQGVGSSAINHVLEHHAQSAEAVSITPLKNSDLVAHLEGLGFKRNRSLDEESLTVTLVRNA
jgi:ribosomal protein S18 acetylase RimI-like enzyme